MGEAVGRGAPGAVEELRAGPLRRVGEGIGKVVYASEHWVVARERSPKEIVALIVLWRRLRKLERILPFGLGRRLLERPSRQIRLLRVITQSAMSVLPKGIWFTSHVRQAWRLHRQGDRRGQSIANAHLNGSDLVPRKIRFPPTRVRIAGWPGWLMVSEATERVEATLYDRLQKLAEVGDFDGVAHWLDRFLEARLAGWRMGVFSTDAHLKNYGICGDQVVLIDMGGLTNRWEDVETRLAKEETDVAPHVRLGLGAILASRPDIATRFDTGWKDIMRGEVVRGCWEEKS